MPRDPAMALKGRMEIQSQSFGLYVYANISMCIRIYEYVYESMRMILWVDMHVEPYMVPLPEEVYGKQIFPEHLLER